MFQTWSNVFVDSFQGIWTGVANFVPALLLAIIVFIIGWLVGSLVGKLVAQIVKSVKVDEALKSLGVEDVVRRAGHELNSGAFLGALVKWFVIVVFLVVAFNLLGLAQVNQFLVGVVLNYLPRVIVAVLMLLAAALISEAVSKLVVAASRAANIRSANFLGSVAKWAILVVAAISAISQLGIGGPFLDTLFTGIVWMLVLAFGLSFGLGGQEAAARFISKIKEDISEKR